MVKTYKRCDAFRRYVIATFSVALTLRDHRRFDLTYKGLFQA